MTRKHFKALAEALLSEKPGSNWSPNKHVQWRLDCRAVASALKSLSPTFKPAVFLKACGLPTDYLPWEGTEEAQQTAQEDRARATNRWPHRMALQAQAEGRQDRHAKPLPAQGELFKG